MQAPDAGGWSRVRVDPAVQPLVEVDLHASDQRTFALTIAGTPPAGEALLAFLPLGAGDAAVEGIASFWLDDGRSREAFALPAGRYLYFCRSEAQPGLVVGLVTVRDGQGLVPIDWRGRRVARSELGSGVELLSVEGESLSELPAALLRLPWPKEWAEVEGGALWMPAAAEYRVLDE